MSNFRPQGNFGNQNQAQFNQQQQFSQNQMNNNPNMRQMQGNPQFQGNNLMQNQGQQMNRGGMAGSSGNDWDQFFQQTSVPSMQSNNNLQNFGSNQMSNDNAANLLLRNNLLQQQLQSGNAGMIDQNLKNSLARTVGMVGGNAGMGNTMGMSNNMMGMNQQQQQMQGRGNVGMGNMNMQQGGNAMGGGMGMRNNNNMGGGGFNDDGAYNPFANDNSNNNMPRGGGGGGISGGSMGGAGGAGGGGNFQMGGGQQRFDGFNNNQFNQINPAAATGGGALDVLNKLNNIVAATGGGLSARQIANARQNPAGSRMDNMGGDNFNNVPSGGGNFSNGPGLQMPQRRGDNSNMSNDVMPGDVRFRNNAGNNGNVMNGNQLTGMRNVNQAGGGFSNSAGGNMGRGGGGGGDNFSSNARSNFDVPPQQMQQQAPRKNNWDVDNYGNTNSGGGGPGRIGKGNFPGSGDVNQYSFSGNKRDRDYSPSRSVSPPYNRDNKRSNNRSPPRDSRRDRSPPRTSGGGGGGGGGRGAPVNVTSNTPFDYWNTPATRLIEDYNAPAVPKSLHTLTATDLYTKFPNLYVPSDFMSIAIDWKSITDSLHNDKICQISDGVPFIFENTPATLAEGATPAQDTPIYTYLTANTVNNALVNNYTNYSRFHTSTVRPVKFNARVIVTCGIPNHQSERIDFNLPRKLRVLCGRRKGGMTLLGTSWSYELDGGDPMQDRSCLLNTARRAVYSQSLLDIFNPEREGGSSFDITTNLTKLCEINYHRPKEELNGKQYPEQEEITAIYLYTMQPDSLPVSQKGLDSAWKIFNDRVKGISVGPMLNKNVDDYHSELRVKEEEVKVEPEAESVEVKIDRTSSAEETATSGSAAEEGKAMAVDDTATTGATAAPASSEAPAASTTGGVEVQKPNAPTLFICGAPQPKDAATDNKKSDAMSLRVTPLSAVLGYSVEDRNERAFETSLAGEIVRSLISVSNADIIVDFFLAEHPTLSHLADVRVVESIKVLREVIRLMRLEMSSGNKSTPAVDSANGAAAATGAATSSPVKKDATPAPDAVAADAKPESIAAAVESESSGASADETTDKAVATTTDDAAVAPPQESAAAPQESSTSHHDAYQVVVNEQEARLWRRRFVAACRWFDTNSDKFFTRDLTRLIIHSSTKNMSRADVASLVERVCKGGRVNYEGFL